MISINVIHALVEERGNLVIIITPINDYCLWTKHADDERIVPLLHKNDHMPYIKYKDPKGGPSWIFNE